MGKFIFIPPVDDSMPPLNAWQWTLLLVSFLVSLALFTVVILSTPSHRVLEILAAFALAPAAMPMQVYAQNRKGRIVGVVFLGIIVSVALYERWGWIKTHTFESSMVVLAFLGLAWVTWCISQTGDLILERLEGLQRRVNRVESKLDRIGRTERDKETRSETEEGQSR